MKELEELLEKLTDRVDYRKCNFDWLKSTDGKIILEAVSVIEAYLKEHE